MIELTFWAVTRLVAHVKFFIHQYPQVLPFKAAPNQFILQSILILVIAPIHVQDLAHRIAELYGVISQVCQSPSGWYPFPLADQAHH